MFLRGEGAGTWVGNRDSVDGYNHDNVDGVGDSDGDRCSLIHSVWDRNETKVFQALYLVV